jgi:arylsulfatase A-like enzyme
MKRFGMPRRSELETAGVDPEEFVGYELDAYDGSIRAMDVEIGRILERLRELGLAERTLIAFVSDHGTEFLDHDQHFHGQSVYGELNRVPLMLWGPGVPAGVALEPTVQAIDLMPTILELAGLEAPPNVQGHSLVPLMQAAERGHDQQWTWPAVTEKVQETGGDLTDRGHPCVSLISDGWKLIHNELAPADKAEYELYDHRADPLNRNDLAREHPDRVAALAEKLREWREWVQAERLDDEVGEADLSDVELERLRSLGYLQ